MGGYRINLGKNRVLRTDSDFILLENSGVLDETFKCAVYNLEVEDFHTYYVGTNGVWVHNADCTETAKILATQL
ncbi:polymorphic toxin-type HINT domain-containing protein [Stenoxybacter acetivorans]|uniref:polymorphic toxin-type HINT domain-containing protein n=1 Tax=Stenoxybacter acetivorans TaxID=422441 RepID=UPI003CCB82C9